VLLRARVSACLEKKRLRDQAQEYSDRLESELQAARDIQMSMVPTIFPPPEPTRPVEISATLEPARQVGGDLYDFFYTDEGQLCFLIGDVSDKGAPAALFMARTKALVRVVANLLRTSDGGPPTPEQIMTRVNDELCRDNGMQMFVTLLLGVLDPMSGALKCCNAGHLAPYVLGRNGVKPLETAQGIPLGISTSLGYDSSGWTLSPGDCLFIFTDGITEAMDSEGKLFGKKRLEEALQAVAREEPTKVVAAVIEKISEFTDAVPQSDDIAAMALRYGILSGPGNR
jgi:sigma-B regulation protein RsbU (phosphoserine phosphatase)